ncbi:hypothetical protein GCM10020221_31380 [Streptomyces thioluteus]|uniref:Dihydroxy-acid dehydratase n=1 Tax=Streptomyces thioluteus TaxID=66431 RepID=A0ABP6JJM0_STRTU
MGHAGMLYSLPSRDLIADSVEYMVEAHCADALICISNCDKITPGMLMAAMRLNIPTVFVSGGPMEAGQATLVDGTVRKLDLINAIVDAVNENVSDEDVLRIEENACPTCGSCSGMFTANSMNCLTEAIGLSLPGNGSTLATHTARRALYENAGRTVVEITKRHYEQGDDSVLPRSIATRAAFENAMALDIAMGGSTNTILHLLAAAQEAELDYDLKDVDAVSRRVPCLAKVAPNVAPGGTYYMEDVHRAGGIPAILGELHRAGLLNEDVHNRPLRLARRVAQVLGRARRFAVPRGRRTVPRRARLPALGDRLLAVRGAGRAWTSTRPGAASASAGHAYSKDGGLAVLKGNLAVDGCVVKTAGVDESIWDLRRPGRRPASPKTRPSTRSSGSRSRRATSSSSATRARAAAPACRRCSTPPRSSRAAAWARRAPWSRTAASPAALRASRSATRRRRRRPAERSRWCGTGTGSASTSPRGRSNSSSRRRSWRPAGPHWAASTRPRTATARSRRRCGRTRRWRRARTGARCGT